MTTDIQQVIVYENEFGNISMCIPSGELPIEQVLAKDCPPDAKIVNHSSLPNNDFDFFDAWRFDANGSVVVNLDVAKEIHKNRLRAQRETLLAAQDVLFQRALEENKPTTAIVAEKKRLRDITDLVDAATTIEDIRKVQL